MDTQKGQQKENNKQAESPPDNPELDSQSSRDHTDCAQKQPEKKRFWQRWSTVEKFTFLLVIFTAVYSAVSFFQLHFLYWSFRDTRRAAVYLGLPDGKIADFIFEGKDRRVALYFRNYGPSAALNTIIEIWPIFTSPDQAPTVTTIPSPPKENEFGRPIGLDIPPGFPHVVYVTLSGATEQELNTGAKHLHIIGRIQYFDAFGRYCETFTVAYNKLPLQNFTLRPHGGPDLCNGKEHTVKSGSVTVGSDKWTQIYPFPAPQPQTSNAEQKQTNEQK